MNLDQVQQYFGRWAGTGDRPTHHFRFDGGIAHGRFGSLHLASAFQPIVAAADAGVVAHEALLRATDARGTPVSPAVAFATIDTGGEIMFFDRLVRMVHAVNFFQLGQADGDLFLNIDFRHVLHVHAGDHGREFESLLHLCGLSPQRIVLEVIESRIEDLRCLDDALAAYRQRGFRIAIDDFGAQHSNFDRLWRLTPDIVKLDRSLVVEATDNPRARRILPKIIDIIHDLNARVVCEGIETPEQDRLARDAGTDFLQGYLYGRPAPAGGRNASALPGQPTPDALAA